jgi:spoIIIJ-associated protein
MNLTMESSEKGEIITINLTGEDRSYLLSNTASLLNGIEYLLNRIFGGREEVPGIVVDSDNYRYHRELELKLLAQMAAGKVLSQKKPLSLQPMVARERKIVHLAVSDIEGVESRSEGMGDNRLITLYPSC